MFWANHIDQFHSGSGELEDRELLESIVWNLNLAEQNSSHGNGDNSHCAASVLNDAVTSSAGNHFNGRAFEIDVEQ